MAQCHRAMTSAQPEPWLRGALPGIPALLQPAAHAFVMAREDVETAVSGLTPAQVWMAPLGVTSLGFHVAHLSGSTDRLLTYARGAALDEAQKAALGRERMIAVERPPLETLLATWRATVDGALAQLAATPEAALTEARAKTCAAAWYSSLSSTVKFARWEIIASPEQSIITVGSTITSRSKAKAETVFIELFSCRHAAIVVCKKTSTLASVK